MGQAKPKQRALAAIRDLPEDATVEDVMERLYFLAKVEEGMRQADAGQTVSNEEAKRRILERRLSHGPIKRSKICARSHWS